MQKPYFMLTALGPCFSVTRSHVKLAVDQTFLVQFFFKRKQNDGDIKYIIAPNCD